MVLHSCDRRSVPFLDILIECELKQVSTLPLLLLLALAILRTCLRILEQVIANSAVQSYTQELWKGGIQHWSGMKTFLFLFSFIVFPPLWLFFSLPLNNKYNKTPIVKFGCYVTSHLFFMAIQIVTSCIPIFPIYRTSLWPHWNEWICLVWLSGLVLGQLISPQVNVTKNMCKPLNFSSSALLSGSCWSGDHQARHHRREHLRHRNPRGRFFCGPRSLASHDLRAESVLRLLALALLCTGMINETTTAEIFRRPHM